MIKLKVVGDEVDASLLEESISQIEKSLQELAEKANSGGGISEEDLAKVTTKLTETIQEVKGSQKELSKELTKVVNQINKLSEKVGAKPIEVPKVPVEDSPNHTPEKKSGFRIPTLLD